MISRHTIPSLRPGGCGSSRKSWPRACAGGARMPAAWASRAASWALQKERNLDLNHRDRSALIVRPEAVDALRTGESR